MENIKFFSVAEQSGKPDNLSRSKQWSNRVEECVYPANVSCRGCSYSYRPDLYDGGCKLHYEARAKLHGGEAVR